MSELNMKLVKIPGKTREDLLAALSELGTMDSDFCGENGPDYMWPDVDRDKYNSNLEYVLDQVKDIETDEELIKTFVSMFLDTDTYYFDYSLEVLYDENGIAECIALATMT